MTTKQHQQFAGDMRELQAAIKGFRDALDDEMQEVEAKREISEHRTDEK